MQKHKNTVILSYNNIFKLINYHSGTGLAIGRTVSGLCPCPDPTDRSRYQNPSGPIRDLNGRVHARFSPKPTEYEVERSGTDPGFKSGTRRLPGYEIGNGTLRMVHISHFI